MGDRAPGRGNPWCKGWMMGDLGTVQDLPASVAGADGLRGRGVRGEPGRVGTGLQP